MPHLITEMAPVGRYLTLNHRAKRSGVLPLSDARCHLAKKLGELFFKCKRYLAEVGVGQGAASLAGPRDGVAKAPSRLCRLVPRHAATPRQYRRAEPSACGRASASAPRSARAPHARHLRPSQRHRRIHPLLREVISRRACLLDIAPPSRHNIASEPVYNAGVAGAGEEATANEPRLDLMPRGPPPRPQREDGCSTTGISPPPWSPSPACRPSRARQGSTVRGSLATGFWIHRSADPRRQIFDAMIETVAHRGYELHDDRARAERRAGPGARLRRALREQAGMLSADVRRAARAGSSRRCWRACPGRRPGPSGSSWACRRCWTSSPAIPTARAWRWSSASALPKRRSRAGTRPGKARGNPRRGPSVRGRARVGRRRAPATADLRGRGRRHRLDRASAGAGRPHGRTGSAASRPPLLRAAALPRPRPRAERRQAQTGNRAGIQSLTRAGLTTREASPGSQSRKPAPGCPPPAPAHRPTHGSAAGLFPAVDDVRELAASAR